MVFLWFRIYPYRNPYPMVLVPAWTSMLQAAYEKIRAGASLVEVYTGLVYKGPGGRPGTANGDGGSMGLTPLVMAKIAIGNPWGNHGKMMVSWNLMGYTLW